MTNRIGAVVAAMQMLRDESSILIAKAISDTGVSEPVAAWGVETTLSRYTEGACASIVRDLDRPCAVLLARSVATAPVRAVTLPLLRGSPGVTVRPARGQLQLVAHVVETLALHDLPVTLAPTDHDTFLARYATPGSLVVAYGRDETLTALAQTLPDGVSFEANGHGFALEVVGADAPPGAAMAVARDIALHDQHGCLSPQTVFVHAADARPFAAALHAALSELADTLPRGLRHLADASAHLQWVGSHAPHAVAVHRARSHVVLAMEREELVPSPGFRHIAVVPFQTLDWVHDTVGAYVTAVATAGHPPVRPLFPHARHVAAGSLQDPPLDGPDDPRPPWLTRR